MAKHSTPNEHDEVHVLFVDDDAADLVSWEAACAGEFRVLTASSAARAMDLMKRYEVAVLLADQRMPDTTGVELLETVRTDFPDTIRILVTAYSELPPAIGAINRGQVRRYLRKPCEPGELRAELADALEVYAMRRKLALLERRLLQTERVYALGLAAAGIAHEIRNPISWINDNVRLAREEIRTFASGLEKDSCLERARLEEVDAGLGDALLGVQRIMEIVQSLELPIRDNGDTSVEVTEVLELVLRMLRSDLRRTSKVEVDAKPVPRVRGTSTQLGQIILNLTINALQALSQRPPASNLITIRVTPEDDRVQLEVLDNGPGIPAADIDRVFDSFYTTKSDEGRGLGLTISKRIVEELGGEIIAENRPAGGACFRVTLPIQR